MASKSGAGKARKSLTPFARTRRLAFEPIEEVAGRLRHAMPRAANDNELPFRLASLGRPVALALVSATLGGLIATLLLS